MMIRTGFGYRLVKVAVACSPHGRCPVVPLTLTWSQWGSHMRGRGNVAQSKQSPRPNWAKSFVSCVPRMFSTPFFFFKPVIILPFSFVIILAFVVYLEEKNKMQ